MAVVVLTGGGGIIGRAMTSRFAQSGHHIAVVDRDYDAARSAAEQSELATAFFCDVSEPTSIRQLEEEVTAKMGPVTGLVCNAASKSENFFDPFEQFPLEDWDQIIRTNLTGPMLCAQVFGRLMAERGGGIIINTLSVYGIVAPDQRIYEGSEYEGRPINTPAVYSASKAGLWGLTKYLASYWGHRGIRVNAITPGGVFSGQNETFVRRYSDRTMLGRMGTPQEVAGAADFLLSDLAAYITGQNIIVDGGLTSW